MTGIPVIKQLAHKSGDGFRRHGRSVGSHVHVYAHYSFQKWRMI